MSGLNKPAMKRIGYFGEEGYATIGDPYKTKVVETMPRYKGAQFQTNPRIKNKFNLENGAFGKKICIFVGCPYVTLDQHQRREKMKEKGKMASDVAFRPTNPSKLGGGNLGSFYGTVNYQGKNTPNFPEGGRIPYLPQGPGVGAKKKGDVTFDPPNIKTAPNPKGGFGYTNTTLGVPLAASERRAWKGVAGEYAYLPDAYDAARKEQRKEKRPFVSDQPFRPGNPGKVGGPGRWGGHRAIAGHPKDCGGTISAFFPYVPTGADVKKTRQVVQEERRKDPYDRVSWKPGNPSKKGGPGYWGVGKKAGGGAGTINLFPVAIPDPYDTLRYDLLKEKEQRKAKMGTLADRTPFNPTSYGRSKCTPSVFTMNIRV